MFSPVVQVGQLDKQLCFICNNEEFKEKAKALLMYAFSNAVIENIKIPELKNELPLL